MRRASRGLPAKKVRSFSKISTARNPAFAAAGSLPSSAPPALKRSIAAADLDWEARVVGAHHKLSKVEELVEAEPEIYGEPWERANQEFHEALVSNCHSRWLRLYLRAMYVMSRRYRMLSLKTKPFPRSQSANEHRRILDAAIKHDSERASQLLADHILKAAQMAEREGAAPLEASINATVLGF